MSALSKHVCRMSFCPERAVEESAGRAGLEILNCTGRLCPIREVCSLRKLGQAV